MKNRRPSQAQVAVTGANHLNKENGTRIYNEHMESQPWGVNELAIVPGELFGFLTWFNWIQYSEGVGEVARVHTLDRERCEVVTLRLFECLMGRGAELPAHFAPSEEGGYRCHLPR